jgi:Dockerin type I domain
VSRTATWTPITLLADGNYVATFAKENVRDVLGGGLVADASATFFVFAGDITGDRQVSFADLLIVAQNYELPGRTFAQGDVNYDGQTNFADLLIVAQKYETSLPALRPASTRRGASDVLS